MALKIVRIIQSFISMVSKKLSESLPAYAIPVFVRICEEVEKTGTFKMKKASLQQDGYDLKRCSGNRVFVWYGGGEAKAKSYQLMTPELQADIDAGQFNEI